MEKGDNEQNVRAPCLGIDCARRQGARFDAAAPTKATRAASRRVPLLPSRIGRLPTKRGQGLGRNEEMLSW